jgi:predicted flap endonuclease-1-like 5' DNA nuclease
MTSLAEIEGIASTYAEKLHAAGIPSAEALLKRGATPAGRGEIEQQSGIDHHHILRWVNQADLFRIKGVEREYAELLEAGGVDSVPELAQRNPEHLHHHLEEINESKHLVKRMPAEAQIALWIEEARQLPRVVSYR